MFISVVHTLLSHPIPSIRRRAMELLSAKLQHQSNFFSLAQDQSILLELIPSLTAIASGQGSSEEAALNQQTAFFTLKLLCRCMGPSASSSFRPVLDVIVEIISLTKTTSYTVLASFLQALAPRALSGPNAEGNTLMLLEYVLRCLYRVCLHDNENFINKERFETLMEPLVDQLENQLGEENAVKLRVKELLVPLLAPTAVAASDDCLWKALHYQLLLKTRDNSPHVRLGSLSALSALVEKLREDYLALLPEAIPFLAELLEDDVNEVEVAAQTTIANMENMLGEP